MMRLALAKNSSDLNEPAGSKKRLICGGAKRN
jgi:hypothetical protein